MSFLDEKIEKDPNSFFHLFILSLDPIKFVFPNLTCKQLPMAINYKAEFRYNSSLVPCLACIFQSLRHSPQRGSSETMLLKEVYRPLSHVSQRVFKWAFQQGCRLYLPSSKYLDYRVWVLTPPYTST